MADEQCENEQLPFAARKNRKKLRQIRAEQVCGRASWACLSKHCGRGVLRQALGTVERQTVVAASARLRQTHGGTKSDEAERVVCSPSVRR